MTQPSENFYNERPGPSAAAGVLALLLGIAVSAAALLLATPQGKKFLEMLPGRSEQWREQAASALAASREKVVSSVENAPPPEKPGRLRENL